MQSSKLKAAFPWHAPQASPFSIAAWVAIFVRVAADRPRMLKSRGWHDTQVGFAESTCMSWLKVTTPGLSVDCASFSATGSRGSSAAREVPAKSSAGSSGMSFLRS